MQTSDPIDIWWPRLDDTVREVLVSNLWMPLSDFVLTEIERHGGPPRGNPFYKVESTELYLPPAVSWIANNGDITRLAKPSGWDPRAAYFRRGWPRR